MHKLLIIMAILYYPAISFAFDETLFLQGLQNEVNRRQDAQNAEIYRQEQEAAEEKFKSQQRRQQYENERQQREEEVQQREAQNQQLRYKRESYVKTSLDEIEQNVRSLLNGKNLQNCLASKHIGVNVGKEYTTGPLYAQSKTSKYTGCAINFQEDHDRTFYDNRVSMGGAVIARFVLVAYPDNNQLGSRYANCHYKNNEVIEELSNNNLGYDICGRYIEVLTESSNAQRPSSKKNAAQPAEGISAYAIGDKLPDGSIVFYIDESGRGGLAAWIADDARATWHDAKRAAAAYGSGWRLPTKPELDQLYKNKDVVGGFTDYFYWSSTEDAAYDAWSQFFTNGRQSAAHGKDDTLRVRAVRAF